MSDTPPKEPPVKEPEPKLKFRGERRGKRVNRQRELQAQFLEGKFIPKRFKNPFVPPKGAGHVIGVDFEAGAVPSSVPVPGPPPPKASGPSSQGDNISGFNLNCKGEGACNHCFFCWNPKAWNLTCPNGF